MGFVKELMAWSKRHFSHLPWRRKRSLYRTLVSEVMLQQTTVSTVLGHFENFLHRYPDIHTLAQATEEEICVAWKGLGYYRRARNLLKAAQFIVAEHKGRFPRHFAQLLEIPGVGEYTASALMAMGRNQRALCIDANIERVSSRLFGIQEQQGPKLSREIGRRFDAGEIYSDCNNYREFNEALMDLGRVICQAKRVDCPICPMAKGCMAVKSDNPLVFPTGKQHSQSFELDLVRCVVKKGGRVLVYQKGQGEWLSGQYELPTFILKSQDRALKQYPHWQQGAVEPIVQLKSGITKYKIVNHVIEISERQAHKICPTPLVYKNFSPEQNLSSITFKILKRWGEIKKPSKE